MDVKGRPCLYFDHIVLIDRSMDYKNSVWLVINNTTLSYDMFIKWEILSNKKLVK